MKTKTLFLLLSTMLLTGCQFRNSELIKATLWAFGIVTFAVIAAFVIMYFGMMYLTREKKNKEKEGVD